MAEPPLLEGACQLNVTRALPPVACRFWGEDSTVTDVLLAFVTDKVSDTPKDSESDVEELVWCTDAVSEMLMVSEDERGGNGGCGERNGFKLFVLGLPRPVTKSYPGFALQMEQLPLLPDVMSL